MISRLPLRFRSLRTSPAYAAAFALVAVQVSIGILFETSQTNGQYSFSASSSVTISECLKFLIATALFYRECATKSNPPCNEDNAKSQIIDIEKEQQEPCDNGSNEDDAFPQKAARAAGSVKIFKGSTMPLELRALHYHIRQELPDHAMYGFAFLALFYTVINNAIFLQYERTDPGTIQLIRSGSTIITALVSVVLLGTKISRNQWTAITLQVCGLVSTQYHTSGAIYPFSTYFVLLFATVVSAVASVYNQKLCQGEHASIHAMNMALYASGTVINFVLHLVLRIIKHDEPGFFTGYDEVGAVLIVVNNVIIGLVMTAVYKYADAIIKCFATALSTAMLLYLSPVLFAARLSFLVIPGTMVVFIATWLYMEATPPNLVSTSPSETRSQVRSNALYTRIWTTFGPSGYRRRIGLSTTAAMTLCITASLSTWQERSKKSEYDNLFQLASANDTILPLRTTLKSPFSSTLAYVRWNSKIAERLPIIQLGYQPFFHTMHYSMPDMLGQNEQYSVNLTHDDWDDSYGAYKAVKDTMNIILNQTSEDQIGGLMYFHFDVWTDPFGFGEMDFGKIWFPDSDDPKYRCMKDSSRYPEWWGWGQGFHEKALQALRLVANLESKYEIDSEEWCVGWSDIYYIPRRYFAEFIELSEIFLAVPVFHELAVPTILHIIDRTHERRPSRSLITRIGDCWGNCCTIDPTVEDIFWSRCGHRLNFMNQVVSNAHFRRLRQLSMRLGRPVEAENEVSSGTTSDTLA